MKLLPTTPPPPQVKTIDNAGAIALPWHDIDQDSFFQTLHARRTHRTFAKGKVSLGSVSSCSKTTWGSRISRDETYSESFPTKPAFGWRKAPDRGISDGAEGPMGSRRECSLPGPGTTCWKNSRERPVAHRRQYCADQCMRPMRGAFHHDGGFFRGPLEIPQARAYRGRCCGRRAPGLRLLPHGDLGLALSTAALKGHSLERDLGIDGISDRSCMLRGSGWLQH